MIPLISEKEFRDGEGWRQLLSEAFSGHQAAVQVAIEALKRKAAVLHDAPQRPGVHPDAATMQEYHRLKGWNQALRALEEMRNPLPEMTEAQKAMNRPDFADHADADSEFMKNAPPKPETFFQPKV